MSEEAVAEEGGQVESQEGSLISEQSPTVDNGPAIVRPEWLQDKYATQDRSQEEAIIEQAKAYNEAQKKLGAFTGAPEEYEFHLPEGVEGDIDTELEAYQAFQEVAKASNMNNETAQQLFEIFVGYQMQMGQQFETDFTEQRKLLGDNADERISNVVTWAGNNLSETEMQVLETMTMTADQIEVVEKLISKTRNSKVPGSQETSIPQQSYTWDDYHAAVGDPRYMSDKSFRERHKKMAAQLSPQ